MSIPDDYIGEPGYPAPWTTSTPREGLRDTDQALIISLAPDVCKSPGTPIPYPVVDFCGHDENYTPSVRFTGQKAMVMRSNTSHVHGDEPGVGKGVVSNTVGGISEPITHAAQVRAEGSHVIRHLDRFHMNNRNTVGEAIFIRDTRTFAAPIDDDPLPGSMVAQAMPFEPYQVAQAATGTMTDAAPVTTGDARPAPSSQTVPKTPTHVPRMLLKRLGIFGLLVEETIRESDLSPEQQELEGIGLGLFMSPLGQAVVRHAQLLGGRDRLTNLSDLGSVFQSETWQGKYGLFLDPDERIAMGNDILSTLAGHPVHLGELTAEEIESIIAPYAGLTEEQIEAKLAELEAERMAEPEPDPDPEQGPRIPVPFPPGVRVDEDPDRPRCKFERICFMPVSPTVDRTEFRRQLKLQEGALNSMTPTEMLGNRGAYLANPEGMRKLSEPLQADTRDDYRRSKEVEYMRIYGPRWKAELDAHMTTVAALHNPDMIAGGAYTSVADPSIPIQDRIGGLNENSSMGSQWRGGRSQRLANHALEQQRNGCPSVQVILEVCVDPGR